MIKLLVLLILFKINSVMHAPPDYFTISKWYWSGKPFPKIYNGWKVERQDIFYLYGYTEGVKLERINVTCDTCGYFKKYTDDVEITYGIKDELQFTIRQNKDTIDKYSKLLKDCYE